MEETSEKTQQFEEKEIPSTLFSSLSSLFLPMHPCIQWEMNQNIEIHMKFTSLEESSSSAKSHNFINSSRMQWSFPGGRHCVGIEDTGIGKYCLYLQDSHCLGDKVIFVKFQSPLFSF